MEEHREEARGANAPALHAAATLTVPEEPEAPAIDVLVLDDSQFDAMHILRECRMTELPVRVHIASDIEEFRKMLPERRYHLVFIDYILPDGDGLVARSLMHEVGADTSPVVMISGEARHDVAVQAMKEGCIDYVAKSELTRDALKALILRALSEGSRLAEQHLNRALEEQRHEIVNSIREVLREELGKDPTHGPEALRHMLQSYGLLPEDGDSDLSDLLQDPATNFIFRTH